MAPQDTQDDDRYVGRPLQFFPVDIGHYDNHPALPTEPEVHAVAALLTPFGAETDAWHAPQEGRGPDVVHDRLAAWSANRTGCDTVLYWVGHGASDGAFHALLAHAKSPRPLDTNGISHLEILQHLKKRQSQQDAGWAAVVVDACKSRRFIELMSSQAILDPDVSDFILVASSHDGSTTLGAFREILDRLLTVTFRTHDTIGLHALAEQINCAMGDTVAYARTHSRAALRRTHPTVVGRMQAPLDTEAEIDRALAALTADERRHFVEKAAGGELGEQAWYFEGRETERYDVLSWLDTTREGLLVVTGPAGSGKSALLGHVLIHTRPELTDPLSRAGHLCDLPPGTPRPTDAFDLAVHLTGVSPQALLGRIAAAVGESLPTGNPFDSQVAWLTGRLSNRHLRRAPGEDADKRFTLLADALDEAHLPLVIAEEVLRPLARTPGVRVVVGTRRSTREGPDLPAPDDEDLLDALGVTEGFDHPCDKVLVVRRDREATTRYIRRRLQTAHERGALQVGQEDIERTVHALGRVDREFLFARLAVHEILHDPGLAHDPAPLLDTDHRGLFARAVQRLTAVNPVHRHLLEALALSQGLGLPDRDDIWSTTAAALMPRDGVLPITGEDIVRLIDGGAPYLMAAIESGQTVYRLAHRAFIEHFARPVQPRDSDDRHRRIAARLARQADARVPDEMPNAYVRHHLADHAAIGGPVAWEVLGARPRLLDRLDALAVRGGADLTGFGRFALPPAVAGVVAAYDRLADASAGDRRGLRELATARCTDQSTPPRQTPDPQASWSLAWARLQRRPLHLPLQGHRGEVVAVTAFASQGGGTLLASAGDDGTLCLWDPAMAEQTTSPLNSGAGPLRAVTALTTPDGRTLLATGTDSGTVHIWNPATADQTAASPLVGHEGPVQAVTVFTGSDGRTLIATGGDDCTVRIWDPATGQETAQPLSGHLGAVQALTAFTMPDGHVLLASGGDDETVRIWDPATGRQTIAPLQGHTGAVQTMVAFTMPDGHVLLASGGDDETIRIWDPATGRQTLPPLEGHTDWIGELTAFLGPDGRPLLASCSDDETIRIWDPATGRETAPPLYGHGDGKWIGAITAFSGPDGRTLLATGSNDRTVRIWDPVTSRQASPALRSHAQEVGAVVAFTGSDGRTLLVTGGDDDTARVWDAATGREIGSPLRGHGSGVKALASFGGPDGQTLLAVCSGDAFVEIWDLDARRHGALALLGHTGAVRAVAACPAPGRGTLLATGDDRTVRLWDPVTGHQTTQPLLGHTGAVRAISAFTAADGRTLLASGGNDGTVRIWDPVGGREEQAPLRGHSGAVRAMLVLASAEERTLLVTGGEDRTVRVWDPADGKETVPPLTAHSAAVQAVTAFTAPDGRTLLATGGNDRTVRIWDPATWTERLVLSVDLAVHGLAALGPNLALATDQGVAVIRTHL